MLNIEGYCDLKEIHKSNKSIVYSAIDERFLINGKKPQATETIENISVIIKIPANVSLRENIAALRHEYDLIRNLKKQGIVSVLDFKRVGNSYCLIREDFGGISLLEYMKTHGKFSINEFLQIVIW